MPDSGGVEGLICKMVLIESPCGGIPLVRGIIRQAVSAGFCDLVLEDGVKTASKLQDDRKIVRVPREVDEILKLIDIGINCLLALKIVVRLKVHKGMGGLILWTEGFDENFMEGIPQSIAWGVVLRLIVNGAISKGCSMVTFHVGQDPVDLGLVVLELCGA